MENQVNMNVIEMMRENQKEIALAKKFITDAEDLRLERAIKFFQPIKDAITEIALVGGTYVQNGVVTRITPLADDARTFKIVFRNHLDGSSNSIDATAISDVAKKPAILINDNGGENPHVIANKIVYDSTESVILLMECLARYITLPENNNSS